MTDLSRSIHWFCGLLLLAVASGATLPPAAHAQAPGTEKQEPSPELRQLRQQIEELAAKGAFGDALPLAERALALSLRQFGPEHADLAVSLDNLAVLHFRRDNHGEAETLFRRALTIREKALGPSHIDVATSLGNLAALCNSQARYGEAENLYRRALNIQEKTLGPENPGLVTSLNSLAGIYGGQNRYAEAEPLYKRVLVLVEKALGPDHALVALSLNNLAVLYDDQNRYADAEPLYRRAIAIREKGAGPEHPSVATLLDRLAVLLTRQNRYADAEPLGRRALAIREKVLGREHSAVATSLFNLAFLFKEQGLYTEAGPLHRRALAIREKTLGPKHLDVAQSLNSIATLYSAQGRYADAEPLHRRALAIREEVLGAEHPDVAQSLNNLASLYENQGRHAEAEPLYRRSMAILEATDHQELATTLDNLASLYLAETRYAEALPIRRRALALREKALGPEHPDVATTLNNLAVLYYYLNRDEEAEPLQLRALAIREKVLGLEHPDVATSLGNIAFMYRNQGRYADAERLLQRTLAIRQKALGRDHPDVAMSHDHLARLYKSQNRMVEALAAAREATKIYSKRYGEPETKSNGSTVEQRSKRAAYLTHVDYATSAALAVSGSGRAAFLAEAFEVAQWTQVSAAAKAVSAMTIRFAAGGDALAAVVRERQDGLEEWRRIDASLVQASSRPPEQRQPRDEASLRERAVAMERKLAGLDARLQNEFPRFAELSSPRPLPLPDAQRLLRSEEALLVWAVGDEFTTLLALRQDRAEIFRLPLGREALVGAVARLRAALDPTDLTINGPGDIPRFDVAMAYELYRVLIAPAAPLLDGVSHLLVVPDGALQSLPLGVLITKPSIAAGAQPDYRSIPWLARTYALSTLPAVSSLASFRAGAQIASASGRRPFAGVGDPLLDDKAAAGGGVISRGAGRFRGAVENLNAVRRLPPLPDTSIELRAEAKALGAGEDDLYLRERATLPRISKANLREYRTLAFATHGVLGGRDGFAEPALVLTPPAQASDDDDGLLTVSRIARMQLDADWVVLSACNTAAGDGTTGAENLSGLARAFFYAGSRAVLVSHWPVLSEVAVEITTRSFQALAAKPTMGRAEALRQALLEVMADEKRPYFAHPMLWAPFVVVGESGRGN